ncbi:7-cyano-7-deazaguanine synthase : 7-cyano-7-deazaguanine synthase OS=Myxococcus fulvus (strain ATCC BAA-855 / HW-1) GN=queC PE=3 SV=1: QueC [Gemmataceae bacterium]|nr:7-cyano-7-deazaguanine synthase : 7-cyano-7-deazaguanine synthase OS=Myxococcus fulvus (strain ATCC BAA-855 / HW-1) GN=queC PE=3 SV=1: QueC [Gemmataceae bacterium]VTT96679.1 7-cyano-7-deazaguanine synthase : 7-cyano-7-deazaguanine synthase OS=Myxococcus fulvus (strain ATCC BAA-855 / HW-1) GN=queC PE=3 SV=1: QueC [Gemmataceae bacterium]
MSKAVVLLSGGLDSTTALAVAKSQGFTTYALSVDYGQRHRVELRRAVAVAHALGVADHRVVVLDLRAIGGSALTADLEVPKGRTADEMGRGVPVTYVPARNTILLGLALGYAETVGAFDLFIGANVLDYSGYPDCRPEFLTAFENLANLATRAGTEGAGRFRVHSPLLKMTKAEIIREGTRLGVDHALTLSCYDPDGEGRACGRCDSCVLRARGFDEAGVPDPTAYQ